MRTGVMSRVAALAAANLAVCAYGQFLEDRITATINSSRIGETHLGLSIVDVPSGETIIDGVRDTEAFIPASNMKLITSGVALQVLGSDYTFRTEFREKDGRLFVIGSGDPAFGDADLLKALDPPMSVDQFVDAVASGLKRQGLTRVTEVVVDDRVFDREFVHPTWPRDQLNSWYCAEVSGVNFHRNVLNIYAAPSSAGARGTPSVRLEPNAPWLPVMMKAKTVEERRVAVWFTRPASENEITVHGTVGVAMMAPEEVTLANNPLFFGRLLAERLRDAGVTLDSSSVGAMVRAAQHDDSADGSRLLAVVSTPMGDVMRRCNEDSQNMYAEALIKRLGHEVTREPGSWTNGSAVIRMQLGDRLGPDVLSVLQVADGSGMSRGNRVSPALVTAWLVEMASSDSTSSAFFDSLAEPGEGTLAKRFRNGSPENRLYAKTGYLDGVRAISGYLVSNSGRTIAFSLLMDDIPAGAARENTRSLQEDIVLAIDRWLAESSARAGAEGR